MHLEEDVLCTDCSALTFRNLTLRMLRGHDLSWFDDSIVLLAKNCGGRMEGRMRIRGSLVVTDLAVVFWAMLSLCWSPASGNGAHLYSWHRLSQALSPRSQATHGEQRKQVMWHVECGSKGWLCSSYCMVCPLASLGDMPSHVYWHPL